MKSLIVNRLDRSPDRSLLAGSPIAGWLVAALAGAAGCGPEYQFRPEDPVFFAESDFAYEAESMLYGSTQGEADRLALFGPNDLAGTGDGYVVLDSGNDRLPFFDRELSLVRVGGGEGGGPGEFR